MKILVIGDSCIDVYVYGHCSRMCPDAPVPIMIPEYTLQYPGMAGNVVRNINALGIETDILTNKEQIEKTRYVDSKTNHMFIRVDTGEESIARINGIEKINFKEYDAVVISDYCKGFLEEDDIRYIAENSNYTFLDTKKTIKDDFVNSINFIKINENEYNKCKNTISEEIQKKIIVTLGGKGCVYQNKIYSVKKVDVKDNTGAGDSFLSGLVVKFCQTQNIEEAIKYANKCATYVVQKKGTTTINPHEIL
jgi:bifunctional ADP-heptose synthase (sugar kinase/adenylyltransferase)